MLGGKRTYVYAATREEALDGLRKARDAHDLGLPVDVGREPLKHFLERWLEDCVKPRCRPRTYTLYRQQVSSHIVPTLGDTPLLKLTPQQVQNRLIAAKLEDGLSSRTVRHLRAVLRSAMSQAEKWLLVPRNVVKLTDPPRNKRREARIFTVAQAKTFLKACEAHRSGALYAAMLAVGLRMGEALGLQWEDVDLDKPTVFVRRALQWTTDQNGSSELRLVEPKSDTSYRVIVLPASIVPLLVRHRANQNRERLLAGSRWISTDAVFTSSIGTMLDERNVRREFYALLKGQNLPRIRAP
jgi:integrase